jgi:signal transduction histidine kinase
MSENLRSAIKSNALEYTILIIEDNPTNLRLISNFLQEYGFRILVDRDGESGLETAKYSQPDLILLDVKLPGIDGFEMCRRLKMEKRLKEIPVIFMTALTGTEDKLKGFQVGAVDYVTKPLQPEEMLARIITHLSNQVLTRELQQANVALQKAHDELELRVARRTADLAASNERLQVEIAERKQAEEKIRDLNQFLEQRVAARTRELSVLYGVAAVASESLDMKATLERLLERVLVAVGCNLGAIHLFDDERQLLSLTVHHGLSTQNLTKIESIPRGWGLVGQVIEQGKPILVSSTTDQAREAGIVFEADLKICAGLPMRAGGETRGVLSVFGRIAQSEPSTEEMALLSTIADLAGVVVESARLRQLAKQAAIMEERERLARELHDSVTQSLYSLTLLAEWGNDLLQSAELEAAQERLLEIGQTAQRALKEMRLLIYQLRPAVLEQEGLVGALQHRLESVERRAGMEVVLQVDSSLTLSAPLEEGLYRIAVEALNNALKHASATLITIELIETEGEVILSIRDDGIGFIPAEAGHQGGLGLVSIAERVEQLGGVLTLISAPGEGTTVTIRLEVP